MACLKPIDAYRKPGGGVAFSKVDGYADLPLKLPCGQCHQCLMERARSWALRCSHEAQLHEDNVFVTLTYHPKHLPLDMSLDMRHWQLFAKRLRKQIGKFRYFQCGEYGDKNGRPHHHAILFGVRFPDRIKYKQHRGNWLYISPTLTRAWKKGFCSIGDVTYESCEYVSRYVLKKRTGNQGRYAYLKHDIQNDLFWEVEPEFVSMSRNPGIGAKWFEKYKDDVYPRDEVVLQHRRFRPPRFYDEKLSAEELETYKKKRADRAHLRKEELTPERLAEKDKYYEAVTKQFTRNYGEK